MFFQVSAQCSYTHTRLLNSQDIQHKLLDSVRSSFTLKRWQQQHQHRTPATTIATKTAPTTKDLCIKISQKMGRKLRNLKYDEHWTGTLNGARKIRRVYFIVDAKVCVCCAAMTGIVLVSVYIVEFLAAAKHFHISATTHTTCKRGIFILAAGSSCIVGTFTVYTTNEESEKRRKLWIYCNCIIRSSVGRCIRVQGTYDMGAHVAAPKITHSNDNKMMHRASVFSARLLARAAEEDGTSNFHCHKILSERRARYFFTCW